MSEAFESSSRLSDKDKAWKAPIQNTAENSAQDRQEGIGSLPLSEIRRSMARVQITNTEGERYLIYGDPTAPSDLRISSQEGKGVANRALDQADQEDNPTEAAALRVNAEKDVNLADRGLLIDSNLVDTATLTVGREFRFNEMANAGTITKIEYV